MKKHRDKERVLRELREAANISRACQRVGITRETYYRWLREDREFRVGSEVAITAGYEAVRDFAESKLMANVGNGNQRAIEYALTRADARLQKAAASRDPYRGKTLADLVAAAGNWQRQSNVANNPGALADQGDSGINGGHDNRNPCNPPSNCPTPDTS